jgi:hypothetical protein
MPLLLAVPHKWNEKLNTQRDLESRLAEREVFVGRENVKREMSVLCVRWAGNNQMDPVSMEEVEKGHEGLQPPGDSICVSVWSPRVTGSNERQAMDFFACPQNRDDRNSSKNATQRNGIEERALDYILLDRDQLE